jgi:hypothetical protein
MIIYTVVDNTPDVYVGNPPTIVASFDNLDEAIERCHKLQQIFT